MKEVYSDNNIVYDNMSQLKSVYNIWTVIRLRPLYENENKLTEFVLVLLRAALLC